MSLDQKTVKQLKNIAKQQNIANYAKLRKSELIGILSGITISDGKLTVKKPKIIKKVGTCDASQTHEDDRYI